MSTVEGLVSVIVPVRDRPRLLVEAVESALAQSYDAIEVIVVDDLSTDDTPVAAAALAAQHRGRVRVLRHESNCGPGPSRETGRCAAHGEFLQYLDSDDLLLPGKFERQVAGLRAEPAAGVSYGWTRLRLEDGTARTEPFKRSGERFETMFPAFLAGRVWNTTTPLYRASVCAQAGPWSDLRLEEDWEYDCRIAALGTRLHNVEDWVCEFRSHAPNRLGMGDPLDRRRLSEQARAFALIHEHARRAGVSTGTEEMATFARALFLLSRKCAFARLTTEARLLFDLARASSTRERARSVDFRLFRGLAAVTGWRNAARLATAVDSWRR